MNRGESSGEAMTVLLKLLFFNDTIAGLIAICCNLLLLFLIFKVKNVAIKDIKIILVPNCILELITSIVTVLTQPVSLGRRALDFRSWPD